MASVRLVDLAKQYQRGSEVIHALDGVTLDIDKGGFVAVGVSRTQPDHNFLRSNETEAV